jgi:hypothetical protein
MVLHFDIECGMLKYSNGVKKVPVIVEGDKVIVGYGGT